MNFGILSGGSCRARVGISAGSAQKPAAPRFSAPQARACGADNVCETQDCPKELSSRVTRIAKEGSLLRETKTIIYGGGGVFPSDA